MATATLKTQTTVTLALSPQEAEHLERLLANHIVGHDNGPRGIFSGIARALANVLIIEPKETRPFNLETISERDRLFLLPDKP